ncbi:MAG: chemotaxis protein CheW [Gemmatimonadota bacterium]|nr:chemotaxis protein CheW [Gemmatimonadota bacterium]
MMVNLHSLNTTDPLHVLVHLAEDERERVLLIDCGGQRYAMSVVLVREVLRSRGVTRVPGTSKVVRGLVNVRGMIVTVLDLSACLAARDQKPGADETPSSGGVTVARAETDGSIVLLEHGGSGRLAGLAVDAVRDVRPLDDTVPASTGARTSVSAGNEVVELLDVAALLARHLISSAET